jgi:hypothetical protein
MHAVYLILAEDGPVKVGYSRLATARLSELQVCSPEQLFLEHQWKLPAGKARALERDLHKAFRWARVRGEWFHVDVLALVGAGNLFVAGRADDARRVAELYRQMSVAQARRAELRHAWKKVAARERQRVDAAAKVEANQLERLETLLLIEALELGVPAPLELRHLERFGGVIRRLKERVKKENDWETKVLERVGTA